MDEKDLKQFMKSEFREFAEEIMLQMNQSGKQETSGLLSDIKKELKKVVAQIEENGQAIKKNSQRISDVEGQMERIRGLDENGLKLYIEREQQEMRKVSDTKYAIKLVEKIVFWAAAIIGTTVIGALLAQVIQ